ncbi:cache domain-containing protein [bacterium]|nr:cache domain-containing protein [bacterium]
MRLVISIVVSLLMVLSVLSTEVEYEHQQTKELVKFVEKAVQLIQSEGTSVFTRFREENSEWFKGDDYIFVWGLNGMRYVYPPDVAGEGQNMIDLEDVDGRPIGKLFIERANVGAGWVHYRWPKPNDEIPTWKTTYIAKAITLEGNAYLVGSGKYDMPCEPAFIKDIVIRAVDLIVANGPEAFDEISDQNGEFIFLNSYVFIKDMKGNEILNPLNPGLEGKNIIDLTDADGKLFVKEELGLLVEQDELWYEYKWPRPNNGKVNTKRVFLKKAPFGDIVYVVGAGYYPDK